MKPATLSAVLCVLPWVWILIDALGDKITDWIYASKRTDTTPTSTEHLETTQEGNVAKSSG